MSKSVNLDDLQTRLADAGVDLQIVKKTGGEIQGLNVRASGAEEWCKASGLRRDRSLGWGRVEARLAANAELRARAQVQAADAVAVATTRAAQQADARLARQPTPEVPQVPRALTPEAVATMKEKIMSDEIDPLKFLSSEPPEPRPLGQALDDADLAPVPVATTGSSSEPPAKPDEDDRARRERIELEAAETELANLFRKKTFDELIDLKNSRVEPVLITGAQLMALLNLVAKVLTLGLFRGSNSFAEEISAKEALAVRARVEIDRRKRTPAGVAERMRVLTDFERAARARVLELDARANRRSVARAHGIEVAGKHTREELEAGFDRLQVHS